MKTKFEQIDEFVDNLQSQNIIGEDEQSLLLVGGAGDQQETNDKCVNLFCTNPNPDRIDNECTNKHCTNVGC